MKTTIDSLALGSGLAKTGTLIALGEQSEESRNYRPTATGLTTRPSTYHIGTAPTGYQSIFAGRWDTMDNDTVISRNPTGATLWAHTYPNPITQATNNGADLTKLALIGDDVSSFTIGNKRFLPLTSEATLGKPPFITVSHTNGQYAVSHNAAGTPNATNIPPLYLGRPILGVGLIAGRAWVATDKGIDFSSALNVEDFIVNSDATYQSTSAFSLSIDVDGEFGNPVVIVGRDMVVRTKTGLTKIDLRNGATLSTVSVSSSSLKSDSNFTSVNGRLFWLANRTLYTMATGEFQITETGTRASNYQLPYEFHSAKLVAIGSELFATADNKTFVANVDGQSAPAFYRWEVNTPINNDKAPNFLSTGIFMHGQAASSMITPPWVNEDVAAICAMDKVIDISTGVGVAPGNMVIQNDGTVVRPTETTTGPGVIGQPFVARLDMRDLSPAQPGFATASRGARQALDFKWSVNQITVAGTFANIGIGTHQDGYQWDTGTTAPLTSLDLTQGATSTIRTSYSKPTQYMGLNQQVASKGVYGSSDVNFTLSTTTGLYAEIERIVLDVINTQRSNAGG